MGPKKVLESVFDIVILNVKLPPRKFLAEEFSRLRNKLLLQVGMHSAAAFSYCRCLQLLPSGF